MRNSKQSSPRSEEEMPTAPLSLNPQEAGMLPVKEKV
jgi:hypothetical protein